MSKVFHLSASIEGMLKLRRISWIDDAHGHPMTTAQVKAELRRLQAKGYKWIPSRGCTSFDPISGCQGCDDEG